MNDFLLKIIDEYATIKAERNFAKRKKILATQTNQSLVTKHEAMKELLTKVDDLLFYGWPEDEVLDLRFRIQAMINKQNDNE